jgi:ComEC/Rec2-related protein
MGAFSAELFDDSVGFCRHRPLFGWTMAIVFGTGFGFFFGGSWLWLFLATGMLIAAWRTKQLAMVQLLWVVCFALAGWRAALLHDRNASVLDRLREYQASGELFDLKATVSNDRHIIQRKRGGPYCRFSVDDAWFADGTEIHGAKLTVYYYDRSGNFPEIGQTWKLKAKLRANSSAYRMYLSARGEHAQHLPDEDRKINVQYLFARVRNRLAQNLALGVNETEALLTQTMVLGTRARLPYELRQRYADAGVIHIFAISGLHVGIIAGLLIWLFSWFGIRLRARIFFLLPVLVGYLLLTGVPPSASRACMMACVFCFAPTVMRRSDGASALFVTAATVLLVEPGWIANAGALLSFCVMGGIFLYTKPLTYFINRLFHSSVTRSLGGVFQDERPWHLTLRQRFAALVGLSLAAWISVLPLCLFFFGRFSPVGILLNLLVPTLTIGVVWCACMSAFIGFLLPIGSILLNRFNATILSLIDTLSLHALKLPGAVCELTYAPGATFSLAMGAGILIFGWWLGVQERRCRQKDPLDPEVFQFAPVSEEAPAHAKKL